MKNHDTYNFWVHKHKFLGTLVLLTEIADASFAKDDYNAILYGLTQSDIDNDIFFEYIFPSEENFTIYFAEDSENKDIIHLQVLTKDISFAQEIGMVDRFQSYFEDWTIRNESYFRI